MSCGKSGGCQRVEEEAARWLDQESNGISRCRPGDIWQVGRHRIACIDSTRKEPVRQFLGSALSDIRMVFADPPYGISVVKHGHIGRQSRAYAPIIGDSSTLTAVRGRALCDRFWPNAVQIWWGANYYPEAISPSRCWIVWDKENGSTCFADAELAWTNQKSSVRIFRHKWNGAVRASERGERRVHPAQKPCALFCWVAKKYGKPGDVIFDPFLGSGISVLGAEMLNDERTVYGCEISPFYCERVLERWEKQSGQQAVLLERMKSARAG